MVRWESTKGSRCFLVFFSFGCFVRTSVSLGFTGRSRIAFESNPEDEDEDEDETTARPSTLSSGNLYSSFKAEKISRSSVMIPGNAGVNPCSFKE